MTILDALDDPRLLGAAFPDASSWQAWRAFLAPRRPQLHVGVGYRTVARAVEATQRVLVPPSAQKRLRRKRFPAGVHEVPMTPARAERCLCP
jgi:hypothetical protein